MKKIFLTVLFALFLSIGSMAQTTSPTPPATTPGNVSRVIYFDVLPGKGNEFTTFLRTNSKVIFEEQIKQGLIVSYGYFTKATTDGPGDWDVGLVVTYKNYADALDPNPERAAKFDAITLKHYGTAEARTKANDSLNTLRTVTSSVLVRGMTLNPMPK